MKNLFKILILPILFISCDCDDDEPNPPYGNDYDDYTTYDGSECYKSISYIYYCENGRYRNISYTRSECCGVWEESTYTSDCIGLLQQDNLFDMTKTQRLDFYNNFEKD